MLHIIHYLVLDRRAGAIGKEQSTKKEHTLALIDTVTGEVLETRSPMAESSGDREGVYWKVYPAAGPAILDVPFGFIMRLIDVASYANRGQRVYLTVKLKKALSEQCDISERMVEYNIARLVRDNALCRVRRGEYIINPYFFGRGRWSDVVALRKDFDALPKDEAFR